MPPVQGVEQARLGQIDRLHVRERALREADDGDVVRPPVRVEAGVRDRGAAAPGGHGERVREVLGKIPGTTTGALGLPGSTETTHSASGGATGMQWAAVRKCRVEITERCRAAPVLLRAGAVLVVAEHPDET
jgi:hypothetical protein